MKLRIFLFCVLFVATTFSYQLNEDENDIELTEEDVYNLLQAHGMNKKDTQNANNDIIDNDQDDDDNDDDDGEEITEDQVREMLQKYMMENNDDEDNEEDEQEPNNEEETSLVEKDDEKSENNEIELLDENNDMNEEEFDMLVARQLKDPRAKALWFRSPRFPRFRFRLPRIRLPRIRFPRIRFPRIRFPRIRFPRIRFPRIRLPRIRFPRIRLPRIRLPRIRFIRLIRFLRPRVRVPPRPPTQPNPCPHSADKIENSIKNIKCDPKWKSIVDYPELNPALEKMDACSRHTICLGCMNSNPWDKAQCNNRLKSDLNSGLCTEISQGDQDTVAWCKEKVDAIINYENGKAAPPSLYYCKCGDDITNMGKPNK